MNKIGLSACPRCRCAGQEVPVRVNGHAGMRRERQKPSGARWGPCHMT